MTLAQFKRTSVRCGCRPHESDRVSSSVEIRSAAASDVETLLALWRRGGVDHDEAHDRDEIVTKLGYDGDLFLVATRDENVVGSVMGTYDGHRGRVKRCVVDPSQQGTGLGRELMDELERRFLGRGITELRLEVWADNLGGQAFWENLGWEHLEDIRYYTRSLR